ncbi:antibiotic biosynthesis monooxygenase [Microbulbifer sp. OS29]|uniref:Antibiotic biosynthesis monooxygenase n=1 Tax=Microbulbifer okhotskensis TaxID=2926617 RepID=A0A9X2EID8_9GAMM|nr:antibiotic biosynthesis monooxygenase [Microbulbifer okhotskensis]MCO1332777.1 antibiotic biosynthesis monooxygenase [Microbulbifer okhotskensis]
MLAVIFEIVPKSSGREKYLSKAAELKEYLNQFDGFISIERFQSLKQPDKILSLSFWRDAASIKAWKNQPQHLEAQELGKNRLFADYRIRIGEIMRDYSM